jgi:hypothetical protein
VVTIGIDCGIRLCGLSVFVEGELGFARVVRNPIKTGQGPEAVAGMAGAVVEALLVRGFLPHTIGHLAIETMQVYQGSRQKGDPNDLIVLSLVGGFLHARLGGHGRVTYYKPREWKGQVPANECCRRVVGRLEAVERPRVENLDRFLVALAAAEARGCEVAGTDHNTIDAVGVGLKALGRFEPHRVIAR